MGRAGDAAGTVRTVRAALRLPQSTFADRLGVHSITVSKWERGNRFPTDYQAGVISRFAEATKVPGVTETIASVVISHGSVAGLTFLLMPANVRNSVAKKSHRKGK